MRRITEIGPFLRIFLTLAVAAGIFMLLPHSVSRQSGLLIAWCGGALFFLIQVGAMFWQLDADGVRRRCQSQKNEGHTPVLAGAVLIALVSITAVIYLLNDVKATQPYYKLHLIFSVATIFSSWFILQAMFAIYYARLFYSPAVTPEGFAGGIRFATPESPDYWDFLYVSITFGMCYGVTDVALTSKFVRRVALVQTLLAFFFYTLIIGLVMNVLGTLF